jgi:hypothetical protein
MKKNYVAPVLSDWGEVTKLTQGRNERNQARRLARVQARRQARIDGRNSVISSGSH